MRHMYSADVEQLGGNLSVFSLKIRGCIAHSIVAVSSAMAAGAAFAQEGISTPPNCAKYDSLNTRGSEVPYPSNCESIFPELGGLRASLYEHGWNVQILSVNRLNYDLKSKNHRPQTYSGERPTFKSATSVFVTHDLSRYGLPDGSIMTFLPGYDYNSFSGTGLTGGYVGQLSAYIPISKNISVQAGYYPLGAQFYGQTLGNNVAASALGVQSSMLYQLGTIGFRPTPAVDVRFQTADGRYYLHTGVGRSIGEKGTYEDAKENPRGLKFNTEGAGAVFINEVGFRQQAGPDTRYKWFRAGVIYNTTDYTRFDQPTESRDNAGFYLVGDIQLTKSAESASYRGWYMNGSVNWARENINAFAHDVAINFYKIGTFPSRPLDMFTVGVSRSFFSKYVRDSASAAGVSSDAYATNISASYTYRIQRGIYLNAGLIYTDHPSIAPKKPSTLDANATLTFVF